MLPPPPRSAADQRILLTAFVAFLAAGYALTALGGP